MVSHVRSTLNQVELVKVYLVCQNAMVGIVVFSIIAWRQQKLVFFMCRHYYTVLCNTLLQKILCFCRRGPSFEEKKNIFYFLPLQGSSCYHSLDEVNCARRFKFRRLFISCMRYSLLLFLLFICALCWVCEAVHDSNSGYCLC